MNVINLNARAARASEIENRLVSLSAIEAVLTSNYMVTASGRLGRLNWLDAPAVVVHREASPLVGEWVNPDKARPFLTLYLGARRRTGTNRYRGRSICFRGRRVEKPDLDLPEVGFTYPSPARAWRNPANFPAY